MTYSTYEDIEAAKFLISPPGDTLKDTIDAQKITQADLAKRMKRPTKTINEIIKGKASITPDTAIQLQRVLGISSEFWMEREKEYRLELAEIKEAERLFSAKDWLVNFPLAQMKSLGWIDYSSNNIVEKFEAILSFFAISNKEAFDNYYGEKYINSFATRMNDKMETNYAVAAWLRKGHLQAKKIVTHPYNKTKFVNSLNEIKLIMSEQPENFFENLQNLCSNSGVLVVHTPCLPKANIHGSTFWINNNPVIQLSNQYKRNDIFWFTFFHEVGHILKHKKTDVFIEGLEYSELGKIKEKEADQFATDYTLP